MLVTTTGRASLALSTASVEKRFKKRVYTSERALLILKMAALVQFIDALLILVAFGSKRNQFVRVFGNLNTLDTTLCFLFFFSRLDGAVNSLRYAVCGLLEDVNGATSIASVIRFGVGTFADDLSFEVIRSLLHFT